MIINKKNWFNKMIIILSIIFVTSNIVLGQSDSTGIRVIQQIESNKSNKLPVVDFYVSTVSGGPFEAPVWIKFYPSGTYDPDGYIVLFEIDMNGDGFYDVQEQTLTGGSYEFTVPGDYIASIRVTDNMGGITIKSKSFTILNQNVVFTKKQYSPEPSAETEDLEQIIEKEPEDIELTNKLDSIIEAYKVKDEETVTTGEVEREVYQELVHKEIIKEPIVNKMDEDKIVESVQNYKIPTTENEENEIGKINKEPIIVKQETKLKKEDEIVVESPVRNVSITNDTTIQLTADSYVYAYTYRNWNEANFGKHDLITVGWHSTGGEKRTYLKFDLPYLNVESVEKAILKLHHNNTIGNNSTTIGVYQVLEQWEEGEGGFHDGQAEPVDSSGALIWDTQPIFNDTAVASFKPNKKYKRLVEIDITIIVKEWLTGSANNGIMLKAEGNLSGRSPISIYEFFSRENDDETKVPVVELYIKE